MSERDRRDDAQHEALSALLDGEADDALREQVESDPALREQLAELGRVDDELRALPSAPVPADLLARVKAQAAREEAAAARRAPRRRVRWLLAAAVPAAAAALLALVWQPWVRTAPDAPTVADRSAPDAPTVAERSAPDAPTVAERPEPAPPIASVDPPLDVADPTPEEILLAVELETLEDLEILELLEALDG